MTGNMSMTEIGRNEAVRDGRDYFNCNCGKRKSEQDKDRGGENCTAEVLSCKKMK